MRVLIELFDRDPIENILGACIFKPEIVVYLCDTRDSGFLKEAAIYRLFKRRKMKTLPRFYYFDASDPVGIRKVLGAVARDYPGCVFDFSGGKDLVLLVAGACFGEMQLPGYYIDLPREKFINLRGCAQLEEQFAVPSFSAEDIFAMTGATVHGYGHFTPAVLDDGFEEDILEVFDIVIKNPKAWGEFVTWLQAFCAGTPPGQLRVEGARRMKGGRNPIYANPVILRHLEGCGVLQGCTMTKNRIELVFKSALHRKCLLIEGVWLELYCYVTARQSGLFNDVRTSVVVDWDGVAGGQDNAKNEVDVFLVKGVTPVFISCKMSLPSALSLSEIKLLSTKFGGQHSRAVLLTAGRILEGHKALCNRAFEMGVTMIDLSVVESGRLGQELAKTVFVPEVPKEERLVNASMLPTSLKVIDI